MLEFMLEDTGIVVIVVSGWVGRFRANVAHPMALVVGEFATTVGW